MRTTNKTKQQQNKTKQKTKTKKPRPIHKKRQKKEKKKKTKTKLADEITRCEKKDPIKSLEPVWSEKKHQGFLFEFFFGQESNA